SRDPGRPRGADIPGDRPGLGVPDRDGDVAAVARPGPAPPAARPPRSRARLREGAAMNCAEFEAQLHAYVDGELGPTAMTAADAHLGQCPECRDLLARERQFRQVLRGQPGASASAELRAELHARLRRAARVAAIRPVLVGAAAAAVLLLAVSLWPGLRPGSSLIAELASKHGGYAGIDEAAQVRSDEPLAVAA